MVDSIAKSLLQNVKGRKETTYSDLVQEGIMALLQAMATYKDEESSPEEFFQDYAQQCIYKSMSNALAHEVRPIPLPPTILAVTRASKGKTTRINE